MYVCTVVLWWGCQRTWISSKNFEICPSLDHSQISMFGSGSAQSCSLFERESHIRWDLCGKLASHIDGNKQRIQQRQRRELAQSIKFAEARLSASLSAAFNYVAGAVCVGHRRPVFSRMAPPLHAVLDSAHSPFQGVTKSSFILLQLELPLLNTYVCILNLFH